MMLVGLLRCDRVKYGVVRFLYVQVSTAVFRISIFFIVMNTLMLESGFNMAFCRVSDSNSSCGRFYACRHWRI